jgi:hypothetical protein
MPLNEKIIKDLVSEYGMEAILYFLIEHLIKQHPSGYYPYIDQLIDDLVKAYENYKKRND